MTSCITKILTGFSVIVVLLTAGCGKSIPGVPDCVQHKIDEIQAQPVTNPPSTLWRYTYHGEAVYFIPQVCCDIPSQLYDDKCNLICEPDGGISGNGDQKCTDFFTDRKNEYLLWQDPRH